MDPVGIRDGGWQCQARHWGAQEWHDAECGGVWQWAASSALQVARALRRNVVPSEESSGTDFAPFQEFGRD